MKLIDFHTHAFPDTLAEKAVVSIQAVADEYEPEGCHKPYTDGTLRGMTDILERTGADGAVLLSVATKPSQTENINQWIYEAAQSDKRIIPFGAVHPDGSWEQTLEDIVGMGFYGVKLHGDFQHFYTDEERMMPLYRRCGELGLAVLLHMGFDYESPLDPHSTPEGLANVLDKVSGTRFVAAHMGGVDCAERAARILGGAKDLWVDTSYSAGRITPAAMADLVSSYGADRVLFASDVPWNDPADDLALVKAAVKSEGERELIFHKNAEKLLGL